MNSTILVVAVGVLLVLTVLIHSVFGVWFLKPFVIHDVT